QWGVGGIEITGFDPADLLADPDHRGEEPIDLLQVLRFGRLDHERPRDREAHRGRVETVVDEPFGDVVDGDTGTCGESAQVDDAFVCDVPAFASVQHRIVGVEFLGDVIRVQYGRGRRLPQ